MQTIAINQTIFGLTLAGLLLFGILYALLVRWLSARNVQGQTALAVVGGVAVTLTALIPLLGLQIIAILFAAFAVSGLPMVAEYIIRIEMQRTKEQADAAELLKRILDEEE